MINCNECNKEFISKKSLSNHLRGGCKTFIKYTKKCSICPNIIQYNSLKLLNNAIDNNLRCKKCANIGRIIKQETKDKASTTLKTLYANGELIPNMSGAHSNASRQKMAKTKTNVKLTEEHKNKIKDGINNSEKHKIAMKSTERGDKISKAFKNIPKSEEHKQKMKDNHFDASGKNNTFYNKKHTIESKLKMRLKCLDKLDKLFNGIKIQPFYNKNACDYFDNLMKEQNCNIQHALNGGEFRIKELGYFLDGYDKENNIAYEWDERRHFNAKGIIKEKDIIRQKEIIQLLGCKFIRIKEDDVIKNK